MLLRSGRGIGHQIQDDLCPICIDVLFQPIKFYPCGHNFCEPCARTLNQKNIHSDVSCPTCRATIERCSKDRALADNLENEYPRVLEERRRYEEAVPVRMALPEESLWYEQVCIFLMGFPFDIINFFCCLILVMFTMFCFVLEKLSLVLETLSSCLVSCCAQLWTLFALAQMKFIDIKAKIIRSDTYVRWKSQIAILSSILICSIASILFKMKSISNIVLISVAYGIHLISQEIIDPQMDVVQLIIQAIVLYYSDNINFFEFFQELGED